MKVCIVCFDEFTGIDVFLPWDLLNRVNSIRRIKNWDVKLVGGSDLHDAFIFSGR